MQRVLFLLFLCVELAPIRVPAASGRLIKVLPQFLDLKGRNALSPSLYDRDAYQAILRQNPDRRSGLRFATQWKTKGPIWGDLKIVVELRGVAEGQLPAQLVVEEKAIPSRWLTSWTNVEVTGEVYKTLGEVTAWRVSLWEGEKFLGEQKSFLW
jgi:hypothetical protein